MQVRKYEQHIRDKSFKKKLNRLLFDLHTTAGRNANIAGMLVILASVVISMIGTMKNIDPELKILIDHFETGVTVFFMIEYMARIYAGRWPVAYMLSIYGIIDLFTWLPLVLFGNTYIALRLLRVLRLLKLLRYLKSMRILFASMLDIFDTIFMVLGTTFVIILVSGNFIHYLEPENFDNAFLGCWWRVVTMTTVGYGDMVPQTISGKIAASLLMFMGITLFALLTGSITVKLTEYLQSRKACLHCQRTMPLDGSYCPYCGPVQQD